MATRKSKVSAKRGHKLTKEELEELAEKIAEDIKELLKRNRFEPLACEELVSGLRRIRKGAEKMAAHIR